MRKMRFSLAAISSAAVMTCFGHNAAEGQALEDQLRAMYQVSKFSVSNTLIQRGSVLIIQKPGFAANPSSTPPFVNNVKGGQVKRSKSSDFLAKMSTDSAPPVDVQVGDGFYLTKLQVKKDDVVFHLRSCGACEAGAPLDPNWVNAVVSFQFEKGALGSAQASDVHALIAQFITTADEQQPQAPLQPAPVAQAPQGMAPAMGTQAAPPVNITEGEDIQQVMSALGPPQSRVGVGAKQVLTYRNLKITFLNGKVSDVQ